MKDVVDACVCVCFMACDFVLCDVCVSDELHFAATGVTLSYDDQLEEASKCATLCPSNGREAAIR
jgi:hypothetical protein